MNERKTWTLVMVRNNGLTLTCSRGSFEEVIISASDALVEAVPEPEELHYGKILVSHPTMAGKRGFYLTDYSYSEVHRLASEARATLATKESR